MKTTIICFSPTGGVEKVAQLIANELNVAAPYDYTTRGYEVSFSSDDLVFFCFPVYGGRIPTPMYDRMSYVHGNGAKAVLVAVYGNRAVEDALLEMSDLCLNRGFKVVGGAEMIAPHSIDKRFGAGRPDASDIAALNKFLASLMSKQELTPVAMPGKRPYKEYKGIPVYPTSSSKCSGCGTCAQECPTEAIDPGDPQHTDKTKCISCMRCVSMCPFSQRRVPKAMQLAASAALIKMCAGRKEPKFYL